MGGTQLALAFGLSSLVAGVLLLFRETRRHGVAMAAHAIERETLRVRSAELERGKQQAEAQAHQLRATLAGMSDGVMMVDERLQLVQWNDRFSEIVGVPLHVMRVGTTMADILRAQAEAGEFGRLQGATEIEAVVAERMVRLGTMRDYATTERTRPDGRVVEIRRTLLPAGGFVSLYTDITARKQAEAAERAAAASAAEAVRQRQQFVTIVSHELRVPLDAVMNSLNLLDDNSLPPSARALVATARRAGSGLHDLVADILDLSRLDAGRLVLRTADFDLPLLLGEVCEMFRAPAAAKGLSMLMVIDAGVPGTLHGDAGRIRQVVINLISNAVKYASPGILTVRATAAGRTLRLTVADPGPAIPASQAASLFQPFIRLDSAEQGHEKGTGLGLAICTRLAAVMGGEMGLAREAGGNAFWLSLPLDIARGYEAVSPEAVARRRTRRASILLVEDVASNRELTAALLRREGHRVDLAENGFTALERASTRIYDLILMDVHMPGIDGIETTRRIRRLPGPAGSVPVIALTGTSTSDDRQAGIDTAMDAVLLKPVMPEDLTAMLRRFVMPWLHEHAPRHQSLAAPGILDESRVAALRDGLAPGMFARLMEQCIADMEERLPTVAVAVRDDPASVRAAAHALAGMAGSYGLAQFEALMREVMRAADAGDFSAVAQRIDGAATALDVGATALRAVMRAG